MDSSDAALSRQGSFVPALGDATFAEKLIAEHGDPMDAPR